MTLSVERTGIENKYLDTVCFTIYLFMRGKERQSERERERGKKFNVAQ